MKIINIYSTIGSKQEQVFLSAIGSEETFFSANTLKESLDSSPDEKNFFFNIHCKGGSVSEGLAIYDILRSSGKNIYMNIEGYCHSMAIVLLLAAPKKQRSANRNARAMIHQVYANPGNVNLEQLEAIRNEVQREQDTILDIYAERTGTDRSLLEQLMKDEAQRTAEELLKYGFIGKINDYTTNFKNNPIL